MSFVFRFIVRISGNGDETNNPGTFSPNERLQLVHEPGNNFGKNYE